MSMLLDYLKKVEKDKLLRFIFGTYIMLLTMTLLDIIGINGLAGVIYSTLIVLAVGLIKEIYDTINERLYVPKITDIIIIMIPTLPINISYLIITN